MSAMQEAPQELRSPRDMYEKAKRELDRMKSSPNIDTIFNFYVTAYHIMDYVKKQPGVPQASIKAFYADSDFGTCNRICNRGKHLKVGDPLTAHSRPGAVFGMAVWGDTAFSEAPSYTLVVDGRRVEVIPLAERLLVKWERFCKDNGI